MEKTVAYIAKNKMVLTVIIHVIVLPAKKSVNNIGMAKSATYIAKSEMILASIIYVIM